MAIKFMCILILKSNFKVIRKELITVNSKNGKDKDCLLYTSLLLIDIELVYGYGAVRSCNLHWHTEGFLRYLWHQLCIFSNWLCPMITAS